MLVINKQILSTRLIINLSSIGNLSAVAELVLYNNFDKKTALYLLPNNTSLYQDRYYEFIYDTSIFSLLATGFYSFKIVDGDVVYGIGMLKVIDAIKSVSELIDSMYLTVIPAEGDDDIITYI